MKRIDALRVIGNGLTARIKELSVTHRDEVIAYLTAQIEAISAQISVEESAESALTERKQKLEDELDDLTGYVSSAKGASAGTATTAKKAAAKRKGAKKL